MKRRHPFSLVVNIFIEKNNKWVKDMDTLLLFYKIYEGDVKPVDYIHWALKMLEDNQNSFSLNILASLTEPYNPFEVEDYFRRSARELNLEEPTYEKSAAFYIRYLSKRIVEDEENAINIAYDIYKVVCDLDYPENLEEWCNISEMIDSFRYGDKYLFIEKAELIEIIVKEAEKQLEKSE